MMDGERSGGGGGEDRHDAEGAGPRSVVIPRARRLLRGVRHRVAALYAIAGLILSVGFLLAILGIWMLAGLTEEVVEGETLRFDEGVLLWLDARATPTLDVIALEITALGNWLVVAVIVAVAVALLSILGRRESAALILAAVVGAAAINPVLKAIFDRPRPELFEWRAHYAGSSSFPSGHAMASTVLFAVLAYVVHRLTTSRSISALAAAVAMTLVLLVGGSRLYLGVHYPSDVVAGFIAGFVWVTFCAITLEVVWPRWSARRVASGCGTSEAEGAG
ncbi:MAG: phosphatase PAP2 family protein [Gemmatimonadota bacterium]